MTSLSSKETSCHCDVTTIYHWRRVSLDSTVSGIAVPNAEIELYADNSNEASKDDPWRVLSKN